MQCRGLRGGGRNKSTNLRRRQHPTAYSNRCSNPVLHSQTTIGLFEAVLKLLLTVNIYTRLAGSFKKLSRVMKHELLDKGQQLSHLWIIRLPSKIGGQMNIPTRCGRAPKNPESRCSRNLGLRAPQSWQH